MSLTAEIRPQPGDVIEVVQNSAFQDPVSAFIRTVTDSEYSHVIVALSEDKFAQAVTGGKADVEIIDEALLQRYLDGAVRMDLFRFQSKAQPEALMAAAQHYRDLSQQAGSGQLLFSDGDAFGLALLRWVVVALQSGARFPELERTKSAVVYAINNPINRTYCAELVYRVLHDAGCQFSLPHDAFLPVDELVSADLRITNAFDAVVMTFKRLLEEKFGLDMNSFATLHEFLGRARDAYERGLTSPTVDEANFVVPSDFARASRSFVSIATRKAGENTWSSS